MRVWALWQGGRGNYAEGYVGDDVETFTSIGEARDAFASRYHMGHHWPQTFNFVHRDPYHVLTPCVGEDAEMRVWLFDPNDAPDAPPFKVIRLGRRGGVRVDHA